MRGASPGRGVRQVAGTDAEVNAADIIVSDAAAAAAHMCAALAQSWSAWRRTSGWGPEPRSGAGWQASLRQTLSKACHPAPACLALTPDPALNSGGAQ